MKETSAGKGHSATSLSCQNTTQEKVSTSKLKLQKNSVRMNWAVGWAAHPEDDHRDSEYK